MKEMIEKLRDKVAMHLYNGPYDKLLENHKVCVNSVLKTDFNHWIEK